MLTKYYDSMRKTPDLFDQFLTFDPLYASPLSWITTKTTSSVYRTEETEDGLNLSIDVPGVKSSDISVQVTGKNVNVSGKRRGEEFKYSYSLSKEYDSDSIAATLEDGVLILHFKKNAKDAVKTIEIKVK